MVVGSSATPVAVIGIGCRLPGGISSPEELRIALEQGRDLVSSVPPDRWDGDGYYDPDPAAGRSIPQWGAFLDDIAGFDCDFFGIGEREAIAIDPQHRLLLETAWEAIEHAGLDPAALSGTATGVFMGLTDSDYILLAGDTEELAGPYGFTGSNFSMASGRIAYSLGSHGPASTVDTACSSSLFALHMACRSLHEGESDMALVGGASVLLEPRRLLSGSAQGMLSPTGRCRAFDAAADGFVTSEGCAVVLLKRLPDALRAGDRVLAVIRGTASVQDGRTVNLATPSLDAQIAVCRAALATAGTDPATVGMVEAHGTGTPVGDPIEFRSLAAVYGTANPCALSSVKSNFGHPQALSGLLGLLKAVLALQTGTIPPNLHHLRFSEELTRIDTKLFVPLSNTGWPSGDGKPRRAAVSSYGLSGTNVHVIVEQAPSQSHGSTSGFPQPAETTLAAPLLFTLSSTSTQGLRCTAGRLADWVAANADTFTPADLAFTLARRRGHRSVRAAVFAADAQQLVARLHEIASDDVEYPAAVGRDDRGPVWVFSGQGSQWPGMGIDLLASEPVFAATVADAEPFIAAESGFSVSAAISAPEDLVGIDRVQPTLFVMQVALARTMLSYGVRPAAVIGHSLGEVAAAVVAGALSLSDGVAAICRRSRLMSRISRAGAMASVELPAQRVLSELAVLGLHDVGLSVVTSPQSTVVGGAAESVRRLVASWEEKGVMARVVAVDVASHSAQVDPILDELAEVLADLAPTPPTIPYYSATLYDPRTTPSFDAGYWVDNLRHTVRFAAAVEAALQDGHRVFAELAPHPLLTLAIDQIAREHDVPVAAMAAMRRRQPLRHGMRGLLAQVYEAGAAVDFSAALPSGRLVDAPLPAWTHRRLLLTRDGHHRRNHATPTVAVHPLLGPHIESPEEPGRHVWQTDVGTVAQPWLADRRIRGNPTFPEGAYCEMALAAADVVIQGEYEVRDLLFGPTLLLDAHTGIDAAVTVDQPGAAGFTVHHGRGVERTVGASARLHCCSDDDSPPALDIDVLLATHPDRVDGAEALRRAGVEFGPAFSALSAVHIAQEAPTSVLGEIALPGALRSQQGAYRAHPALLDACFQSIASHPAARNPDSDAPLKPLGIARLRSYATTRDARYCLARLDPGIDEGIGDSILTADIDVLDEHGAVLLAVNGLRLGRPDSANHISDRVCVERLLTIEWAERELPDAEHANPGTWLLITTSHVEDRLAIDLSDALGLLDVNARCRMLPWPVQRDNPIDADTLADALRTGITGVVVFATPPDHDLASSGAQIARENVEHVLRITHELTAAPSAPPRLYVVTKSAHAVLPGDRPNLDHAGLRGLMRVIDAEHPYLHATQIDVDGTADATQLARQLLGNSDEDETAWRKGRWYTARLDNTSLQRRLSIVNHEHDGMRLGLRTPGDPGSMELLAAPRVPPGPGQIEVAITAASVNFADALIALGDYPSDEPLPPPGRDFAGVVTAVGSGVSTHQVGDRVGGVTSGGCWGTYLTCDARHAVTLPAGLADEVAAAAATVYTTAWYALHELARIVAGSTVLIHSATGGVGQAAIAIARAAGAEIFATAGSPQRRTSLRDGGIDHVYDSRSIEFADQIQRDTRGRGIDIVLNSLTGPGRRAGLSVLAPGGRFVELGRRNIHSDVRMGLLPFRRNLAFYGLDLPLLIATSPNRVTDVLKTVYRQICEGVLTPPAITRRPLNEAATALDEMAAAEHTGKLVLDIPRAGQSNVVVPPEQVNVFRPDGAYIVTGGLGGLGLFLAEKMAAAGCGRIVITSRSAPSAQAAAAVERIRATGADVQVECGDVTEPATAELLVKVATATGLPLRGVLHAAGVVEDATLHNLTADLLARDWAPKANGAWNLHHATAAQPLDWFCLFSSAAALVGAPGQGAYAAANSWLDAFAHWRRAQGLPATAIAWGAWAEIGRAATLAESEVHPAEGAAVFEALLRHEHTYTGYTPMTGAPWVAALVQRSRFAENFRHVLQNSSGARQFRADFDVLPQEERPARLRRLVTEEVSRILRRGIDPDRPLTEYGLDSLGNLEVRTRIETETGIRIATTDITTVRGLAEHLHHKLAVLSAESGTD